MIKLPGTQAFSTPDTNKQQIKIDANYIFKQRD